MPLPVSVRVAEIKDVEAIGTLHAAAWHAAYTDVVPKVFLDGLKPEHKIALWQQVLSAPVEAGSILVAEQEQEQDDPSASHASGVVGFLSFGSAPAQAGNEKDKTGKTPPKNGEVRALYIEPRHWSAGVGQCLWTEALERLAGTGHTTVSVSVFARNARAIRFYQAAGLAASGAGETEIGGATVATLDFSKALE